VRSRLRWLLAASLFAASLIVRAASLDVTPTRVDLTPIDNRQVIELHNNDSSPVLMEVQSFLWTQEDDGQDLLSPTEELLAVPPIFTVPPNDTQTIRLGFRAPPDVSSEQSYRLILTQVPNEAELSDGIAVLLRLSLPVFYTPRDAEARPEWSVSIDSVLDTLEVRMTNNGTANQQIRRIFVMSPDRPDEVLAATEGARYVLAGSTVYWGIPLGRSISADEITIVTETDRGEIQYVLSVDPQ